MRLFLYFIFFLFIVLIESCAERDKFTLTEKKEVFEELKSLMSNPTPSQKYFAISKIEDLEKKMSIEESAQFLKKCSSYLHYQDSTKLILLNKSLDRFKKTSNINGERSTLYAILLYYFHNNNYGHVLTTSDRITSLGIDVDENQKSIYINSIMAKGIAYRKMGHPEKSIELYENEIDNIDQNSEDYLIMNENMASVYENTYDLNKLYKIRRWQFEKSLEIKNPTLNSISESGIAYIFESLGNKTKAEKYYTKAINTALKIDDAKLISDNYIGLLKFYINNSYYSKALDKINEFKNLKLDLPDDLSTNIFRYIQYILELQLANSLFEKKSSLKKLELIRDQLYLNKDYLEVAEIDMYIIQKISFIDCNKKNKSIVNLEKFFRNTKPPQLWLQYLDFQLNSHCSLKHYDKLYLILTKNQLIQEIDSIKSRIISADLNPKKDSKNPNYNLTLILLLIALIIVSFIISIIKNKKDKIRNQEYKDKLNYYYNSINHDLKKPLTHFIRELNSGNKNLNKKEMSLRLNALKQQMKKYADIFSIETEDLLLTNIDIGSLIDDITTELDTERIRYKFTNECHGHIIKTDTLLIRILLTNVIENAMKFSRTSREPEIKISVVSDTSFNILIIEDNGIGIHKKTISTFEAGKVHHSLSQGSNSGLGLFLSQEILKKLKGTISLKMVNSKTNAIIKIPISTF